MLFDNSNFAMSFQMKRKYWFYLIILPKQNNFGNKIPEPYLHCEWNEPVIFDQMGKQFTAINQDSKIVNQGFPIEEIIGSHQKIPITGNKIQVNILSKNCFNTMYIS